MQFIMRKRWGMRGKIIKLEGFAVERCLFVLFGRIFCHAN